MLFPADFQPLFLGSTTTTKTKTVQKNGDINKQTSKVSLLQGKFGGGEERVRYVAQNGVLSHENGTVLLFSLFSNLFLSPSVIYLFFTRLFVVVVADIDTFILTGNGLVM